MSKPDTLSVIIEREFSHQPEKIWRALTQPHLIAEWLMKNDFAPAVGHRFNFREDYLPNGALGPRNLAASLVGGSPDGSTLRTAH